MKIISKNIPKLAKLYPTILYGLNSTSKLINCKNYNKKLSQAEFFQHYWTRPTIETLNKQDQFIYAGTRSTYFVDNHVLMVLATYDPKIKVENQFK